MRAEGDTTGEERPGEAEASEDEPGLEQRLTRLDQIVRRLEGGEVKLEEGLRLFEEGVRHVRMAERLLARAELRVEELLGEGEEATRERFEEEGTEG